LALNLKKNFKKQITKNLPAVVNLFRSMRGNIRAKTYKLYYKSKPTFACSICGYEGPFGDYEKNNVIIKHTQCPKCELYERHRLQFLVFGVLAEKYNFSKMCMLHFAPEPFFKTYFQKRLLQYDTADIEQVDVDHKADICQLPFDSCSYDIVFASHVLEHVGNDHAALTEIRRILKQNGLAVLPVPVVSSITIEYKEANPWEFGHVRAVGPDYFDKYRKYFSKVDVWHSGISPKNTSFIHTKIEPVTQIPPILIEKQCLGSNIMILFLFA
jgi:SAM-dependent methyltransferase